MSPPIRARSIERSSPMPLYEYECQDCKENFEKLMRITGVQLAICPSCGSVRTVKKISAFAANIQAACLPQQMPARRAARLPEPEDCGANVRRGLIK